MNRNKFVCVVSLLIIALIASVAFYFNGVASASPRVQPPKGNLGQLLIQNAPQVKITQQIQPEIQSKAQIKDYVDKEALKQGVSVSVVDYIVKHESVWNLNPPLNDVAICKDRLSFKLGQETASRGLWQINDCFHPEVSIACANSLQCSTAWSLTQIKAGHITWWSSYDWLLKHPTSVESLALK